MLSGLKIKAVLEDTEKEAQTFTWTYNANTLLGYMQQVWPGVDNATPGNGSKAMPYTPKTPKQWFYCAKVKGSGDSAKRFPNLTDGMAWFKIGGRFIGIDPNSLYSSDYGTTGAAVTLNKPTYPNLKSAVLEWQKTLINNDARLASLLRDVMAGKPVMGAFDALPVLAAVLFLSEVTRNHTAFHTNLMAMDLIQKGLSLPTSGAAIPWTWANAIWIEDACPVCACSGKVACGTCGGSGRGRNCGDCRGSGWYHAPILCKFCGGAGCWSCRNSGIFKPGKKCNRCKGLGYFACNACDGDGDVKCGNCKGKGKGTIYDEFRPLGVTKTIGGAKFDGGGQALQNGLLPMSHKGSAFGSAFDLTGEGAYKLVKEDRSIASSEAPSALMVVRRKEATVLIQWLQHVLDGCEYQFSKTQKLKISATPDQTSLTLTGTNIANSYEEVTQRAVDGRTLADDTGEPNDLQSEVKDTVRAKIVSYMQIRAETFSYLFEK